MSLPGARPHTTRYPVHFQPHCGTSAPGGARWLLHWLLRCVGVLKKDPRLDVQPLGQRRHALELQMPAFESKTLQGHDNAGAQNPHRGGGQQLHFKVVAPTTSKKN